jgi:hypothetical protein
MKEMKKYLLLLGIIFFSCTHQNQRSDKTPTIPSNNISVNQKNTAKPLIIGGKQYSGYVTGSSLTAPDKAFTMDDIDDIDFVYFDINPLDPAKMNGLNGVEQLFGAKNLKTIRIDGRNLDKVDLSLLEQFSDSIEIEIWIRGNSDVLPDLSLLESLDGLNILDAVFEDFCTLKIPTGLKGLTLSGENLHKIDLSIIETLHELTGLRIEGDITRLPDLTKLEKLRDITIENAYLESLEGIGAPNIRWIEINNGAELNSLAPLNNLPHLEFLTIISRGSTTLRIADISNLPNLKNLRLLMPFTRIDLQGIENMPMLGELWITESESFNIEGIGKLGNLWRLFLKLVSPQPSVEFLRGMPNLSELSLFGDIEFLDIYPIQSTEPYQILDFSPLATIKNLRRFGCTGFIIKNIAALDVLDALSIRDDESPGYIYLAGSRLYDSMDRSRHPLVLEHPFRE